MTATGIALSFYEFEERHPRLGLCPKLAPVEKLALLIPWSRQSSEAGTPLSDCCRIAPRGGMFRTRLPGKT